MKHYLITRFNLKNKNWQVSKSQPNVLSSEWLDDRFDIFEAYCLPSVLNQSCTNFKWLLCFDSNTPKAYYPRIENFQQLATNFHAVFIDGFEHLESELTQFIKNDVDKTDTHVITTRLDNDDIIHRDFIKTIQELSKAENAAINLDHGYQLILNNEHYSLRYLKKAFNPFMSVVSDIEQFESVLSREHHHWKSHPNQIMNQKDRLWIEFVHGNNIVNDISKASKKTRNFNASEFGLKTITIKERDFEVILYNIVMYPYRIYHNLKTELKHILKSK